MMRGLEEAFVLICTCCLVLLVMAGTWRALRWLLG